MKTSSPLSRSLLAALLCLAGCGGEERVRPNVILISLDTCRADALGYHGAPRPTPALDALAEQSVVFEDCLAQSSATAPSHMSILTGHTVQRHGLMKNGEARQPAYTLASLLKDVGYRTAAFTGNGSFQKKYGHGMGFDLFRDTDETTGQNGQYQRMLTRTIPEAEAWLDTYGESGPFFLVVHGYDPHLPFWPDEPKRSEFAGWYQGDLDISELRKRTEFHPIIAEGRLGAEEERYLRDLYDAEIALADEALGGFLDDLERRGLFDSSLVIFTSDHGELLGEHDWVGHGLFYGEVAHVPLLLRFPGMEYVARRDDPVAHVDIVPTVLGFLGVAPPAGLQGHDLLPGIRAATPAVPDDRLRVGQRAGDIVVRDASDPALKLLFKRTRGGLIELEAYDLSNDPDESADVSRDPAFAARVRAILQRYSAWSDSSARDDGAYRGELTDIQAEDVDMLRALGYLGEDEGPETPGE